MIDFRQYRALSFDCYGTLIDWEAGILAWARRWIARSGARIDDSEFLAAFGRLERMEQSRTPDARYPRILANVLRRIGADHDLGISEDEAESFGASVGDWPAFADSPAALAALQRRYQLILLSNVDRASFQHSNTRLDVAFDRIITAEDVGSYKPDRRNFETLLVEAAAMGVAKDALLHVGESLHHDAIPAQALGIDFAWINRAAASGRPRASGALPARVEPLAEFASIADFAAAAAPGGRQPPGR